MKETPPFQTFLEPVSLAAHDGSSDLTPLLTMYGQTWDPGPNMSSHCLLALYSWPGS